MNEVHSKQGLCVAKDLVYNATKHSEISVDAIIQEAGILATRSSLKVHDSKGENKEEITARFAGGIFSLTKSGAENSLPDLSIEKQNNKGELLPVPQGGTEYETIKGKLLHLDQMFNSLPKCELDKD